LSDCVILCPLFDFSPIFYDQKAERRLHAGGGHSRAEDADSADAQVTNWLIKCQTPHPPQNAGMP